MRLFECEGCNSALHFDNTVCVVCGRRVGFLQDHFVMGALEGGPELWNALATGGQAYRFCGNAKLGVCNWMLPAEDPSTFCDSCRHNRIVPDLSIADNVERWRRIELAKRYVVRALMRWGLPRPDKTQDPERGLAFDIVADETRPDGQVKRVLTGHDSGLITLNVAEGDDAEREARRTAMGEPYRTLVGHFRHEIGHYYWDRLVGDEGRIGSFRATFGDESRDYGEALERHYRDGPPTDWRNGFVSAYASAHPWEDFAECWAHYLHIVDALETARSYGIDVRGAFAPDGKGAKLNFEPYDADSISRLVDAWVPLTVALNGVNRSMGQPDLYPFVLSAPVVGKLEFIHELIRAPAAPSARAAPETQEADVSERNGKARSSLQEEAALAAQEGRTSI